MGRGVADATPTQPAPITGTDGKTYAPTSASTVPSAVVDEPEPRDEIVPGMTADELSELNVPPAPPRDEQPVTPRRRAITDAFDSATYELRRSVDRVVNLRNDDRFTKNKDQIKASNLSDLVRVRDALNSVIAYLEG